MKTNQGTRLHSKRVYKPQSPTPEIVTLEIEGHKISWVHHPELDGEPSSYLSIPSKPQEGKFDFDLLPSYIIGTGENFSNILVVSNTFLYDGSVIALDETHIPILRIMSCTAKRDIFETIYVCVAQIISNDPSDKIEATATRARYMFHSGKNQ